MVIVGVPSSIYPINSGKLLAKEQKMVGVRIHSQSSFKAAIDLVSSKVLDEYLEVFIDAEFHLEDFDKAIKYSIEDQEHFKIVIKINK